MTGTASPGVASRPPVATLPGSGWQRRSNNQGKSPYGFEAIFGKVCNFEPKKVRNFHVKLTHR